MREATATTKPIDLGAVKRGFTNPALESQLVFRSIMNAVARPGLLADLTEAPEPPRGINRATGAIALTLFDFETTVWLDPAIRGDEAEAWLRFHAGCPMTTDPLAADFAIVTDAGSMPRLETFNIGDAKYPNLSTTIIVEVPSLAGGTPVMLAGPGIKDTVTTSPDGLPADFWSQVAENGSQFQFGVDLLLTSDASVMGLPRTVRTGGTE